MAKRRARLKNNGRMAAEHLRTAAVPEDVAAAIKRFWPQGVVQEFPIEESYLQEIRRKIERNLRSILGASLVWQTEETEEGVWDDDNLGKDRITILNGSRITSSSWRRTAKNSALKTRRSETMKTEASHLSW